MTWWRPALTVLFLFVPGASAASACYVKGWVRCDTSANAVRDPDDVPLAGVTVTITGSGGKFEPLRA